MRYVSPSVSETAFNCPHCGTLTTQTWLNLYANRKKEDHPHPIVITTGHLENLKKDFPKEVDNNGDFIAWAEKMAKGMPFFQSVDDFTQANFDVWNVNVASCYECKQLSIWCLDRLIYPQQGEAPPPNADIPDDILIDYREASSILNMSPRGAAALIRLAIQKLCKELGQPGINLNSDIGALVADGLSPRVQQALDAVRVIGNNAVHPGQIDLRDDRATAETLFRLLNLITEKTISEQKHVDEVYASLPDAARSAIAKRDAPKKA